MRFLLNKRATSLTHKAVSSSSSKINSLPQETATFLAWGQQCSSKCGCIVRFEAQLNASNQIIDVAYFAKTAILSRVSCKNKKPLLTDNGRILFKDCRCSTLHILAESIINSIHPVLSSALKLTTMTQLQNSTEFAGFRSSPAFRHTILSELVENGKGRRAGQDAEACYDLVEEAFLSLVRGHMPSPRERTSYQYRQEDLASGRISNMLDYLDRQEECKQPSGEKKNIESNKDLLNPMRFAEAAKRAGRIFYERNSFSPVTEERGSMFTDYTPKFFHGSEFTSSKSTKNNSTNPPPSTLLLPRFEDATVLSVTGVQQPLPKTKIYDWVSYVDELHHHQRHNGKETKRKEEKEEQSA